MKAILTLIAAAALAGCSNANADGGTDLNAADTAEMEDLKAWGKQLKADDPDTTRALVKTCMGAGSFFSDQGKLQIARCMKQHYDAGDRA